MFTSAATPDGCATSSPASPSAAPASTRIAPGDSALGGGCLFKRHAVSDKCYDVRWQNFLPPDIFHHSSQIAETHFIQLCTLLTRAICSCQKVLHARLPASSSRDILSERVRRRDDDGRRHFDRARAFNSTLRCLRRPIGPFGRPGLPSIRNICGGGEDERTDRGGGAAAAATAKRVLCGNEDGSPAASSPLRPL